MITWFSFHILFNGGFEETYVIQSFHKILFVFIIAALTFLFNLLSFKNVSNLFSPELTVLIKWIWYRYSILYCISPHMKFCWRKLGSVMLKTRILGSVAELKLFNKINLKICFYKIDFNILFLQEIQIVINNTVP